ncbi:hypothetical protein VTG60DRAFT_2598 [Thermothelomyces hinnuleus]
MPGTLWERSSGGEEMVHRLLTLDGSTLEPSGTAQRTKRTVNMIQDVVSSASREGGRHAELNGSVAAAMERQQRPAAAADLDQCLRLQRYETSAYGPADCQIHLGDGEPIMSLVFKWAGDPASRELVEGTFNLEHWQKTHKIPLQ